MWSRNVQSFFRITRNDFKKIYLPDLSRKCSSNIATLKIKEILRVTHANWQAYLNFERGCDMNLEKMKKLEELDEQLFLLLAKYDVKESDIAFVRSNATYTTGIILSKICKPTTQSISSLMKEFSSTFFDDSLRETLKIGEGEYEDVCQILKEMRDNNTIQECTTVLDNYPVIKQLSYKGYSLLSKIHANL